MQPKIKELIKDPVVETIKDVKLPEKKFRAGAISATIWLNKSHNKIGEDSEYRTITIERSYNKEGQWQSTNALRLNDLPKACVVLQKAYEHIILNDED